MSKTLFPFVDLLNAEVYEDALPPRAIAKAPRLSSELFQKPRDLAIARAVARANEVGPQPFA